MPEAYYSCGGYYKSRTRAEAKRRRASTLGCSLAFHLTLLGGLQFPGHPKVAEPPKKKAVTKLVEPVDPPKPKPPRPMRFLPPPPPVGRARIKAPAEVPRPGPEKKKPD